MLQKDADTVQNNAETGRSIDAELTRLGSLDVLARALMRARPGHPRAQLVGLLAQQCRNFDLNPDAMRPKILRTIEAIEAPVSLHHT